MNTVMQAVAGSGGIVLHDSAGAALVEVAPGSGATYRLIVRDAASCERLIAEMLLNARTQVVPQSGGLMSSLSVLENVVLPSVYHGLVAKTQLAELVYREFDDCGVPRKEAEALCAKAVTDLTPFERRLTALVRALMMRPSLLVMERSFEGLSAQAMQEVTRFPEHYRRSVPTGTVVMLDLAGMMCPEIPADLQCLTAEAF